jgi:hypothetical protein
LFYVPGLLPGGDVLFSTAWAALLKAWAALLMTETVLLKLRSALLIAWTEHLRARAARMMARTMLLWARAVLMAALRLCAVLKLACGHLAAGNGGQEGNQPVCKRILLNF